MKKNQLPTTPGAVAVSLTLQRTLVFGAVGVTAFQILLLFPFYVFNKSGYRGDSAYSFVIMAMVPIIYFGIAYLFGPKYPVAINRWFMAVLKAVIALIAANLLQLAANFFLQITNTNWTPLLAHDRWYGLAVLNNAAQLLVVIGLLIFVLNKRNRI